MSSITDEFNVQLQRLQRNKAAIQQALIAKGIEDADEHGMDDFASDIYSIKLAGTTAPEGYGLVSYNAMYLKIE